jgi:hypothetical protein
MDGALSLHPKTVGGTGAATLGILTVWILGLAHVTVDPVVAAAMVTAYGFAGAWLAPLVKHEVGGAT